MSTVKELRAEGLLKAPKASRDPTNRRARAARFERAKNTRAPTSPEK